MTYATRQDLIDRFGEEELAYQTDADGSGSLDAAAIDRALADADTLINGYLARLYALPLASTPDLIKSIACDIARYRLYKKEAPQLVRDNYQDALKRLEAIQRGAVALDLAGTVAPTRGDTVQLDGSDRVLSRDTLRDF